MTIFQESKKGEVDLSGDDEEAVECMIHYFYYLDYYVSENTADELRRSEKPGGNVKIEQSNYCNVEDPLIATAAANAHVPGVISTLRYSTSTHATQPISSSIGTIPPGTGRQSKECQDRACSGSTGTKPLEDSDSDDNKVNQANRKRTSQLVIHARVYALAEKYDVQGLKTLAFEKFELLLADQCAESDLLEVAEEVYTSTIDSDRGLRNLVLQCFRKRPSLASSSKVQSIIEHIPLLAFDLYRMSWGIPMPT